MIAAVLCPGPSLARATVHADFIVGVNRAPFIVQDRIKVDQWCFGNGNVFADPVDGIADKLNYLPRIYLKYDALYEITNDGHFDKLRKFIWRPWEELFGQWPAGYGWSEFSATAALTLAASAGATTIQCYGCDWTNEPDADGVQLRGDRSDRRWKEEGAIWKTWTKYLSDKGITVERIAS